MRTKLRSKLPLLFVVCALLIAVPVVAAFADDIVNDVVVSSNSKTITKGKTTTVNYWIEQQGGDGQTGGACNASDGSPLTITVPPSVPAGVTVSGGSPTPNQLQFSACGPANAKSLTFTSNTVGSYSIPDVSFSDSGAGSYDPSTTDFSLHVAPFVSSTSPVNGTAGVATSTNITASFSDPILSSSVTSCTSTVTDCTFKVVKSGSTTPVPGSIAFMGGNPPNRATFTPSAPLDPGATYDVTVEGGDSSAVPPDTTGVKSSNGITLLFQDSSTTPATKDMTFSFTTATPTVTTTTVSNITASASTFGGQTNLSATVSPLGAPGSVAFYVNGSSTPAAGTVTYNSSTGVATLSNYAHGLNASTSPYSVKAVFTPTSGSNYSSSEATNASALTVNKADTTTTVTCGAGPFTYTGSAQTPCSAKVTGPGGLDQSLTVDYTNNTNAGTATASASYAETANYKGSSDSKTFTIGKASSTTTVSCGAGPFTYDGTAKTPCTVSVTGAGGLNLSPAATYANNTGAGTATASYTYAGDANHNGSSDSKTFTIGKASSTTTVTCTGGPFTYTGNPITPCSANVTGAGGLDQAVTPVSYDHNVNSGTADASASYAGDANHNGSNDTAHFTIDKASSTTKVTCGAGPFTYDGTAKTPCSASVTGVGGLSQSLSVTYANNTGAGTADASASYAGDANHNGSNDTAHFTIDKASSTTTVTCPASVPYTGSAVTPCSASVTGAGGLNQSLTVSYTNNTGAGTADASASYAGDANHNGSSDSKTFTITYNFTGFSSPVDNNNVLNSAKAGQAIPLKWRLTDASGNPVTNLSSTDVKVSVANYNCGLSTTTDLLEEYAAGASGLQNLGNGYYQFNWKSPTNYANSCKTMTLDLGEGTLTTPHTALFKFTK